MTLRTLTVEETAELLHLHPETVRRMAVSGELPATKLGRKWLFLEDALRTLLTPEQQQRKSKYPDLTRYMAMAGVKE